jgi:hypothetical protein
MEIGVQNTEYRQIGIMYQWQKSEQDNEFMIPNLQFVSKRKMTWVTLCAKEIIPEDFHNYYAS